MKYIITESQNLQLMLSRRLGMVSDLMRDGMDYYPPCDYFYVDGFFDYYGDIRSRTLSEIIEGLGLSWGEDESEELYNKFDEIIFVKFYDEAWKKFSDTINMGCDEHDNNML